MGFEEIKRRCDLLKKKVLLWKEFMDNVNEFDYEDIKTILNNLHKIILEALSDNEVNELLNFPLASCELVIRAGKRHDMSYSDISKSLYALILAIEVVIKKKDK